MALLDIRNLNIEIQTPNGRMKIVDGVNLSLNEGEILRARSVNQVPVKV